MPIATCPSGHDVMVAFKRIGDSAECPMCRRPHKRFKISSLREVRGGE